MSNSSDENLKPFEQEAELEALSQQMSDELSVGGVSKFEELLKQVPSEHRAALLKRLNSMAAGFVAPAKISDSRLAKSDETFDGGAEQVQIDSASNTQTHDAAIVPDAKPIPPRKLGSYELEGELGRGGMGVVYRARHHERNDVVALKILPQGDGESLHRFKREFRSLADISHPNLIGLRELESDGGQWFFTMELIDEALSFRKFVRPSNEFDEPRLRSALGQLSQALTFLHSRGIIHRDIKPSNVLVDQTGRVRVVDFGLVMDTDPNQASITQGIAGTPAYMAPEAVDGHTLNSNADWYAVGVLLYECLVGELPFQGSTLQILAAKSADPPLDRLDDASFPRDLADLCRCLLHRDPEVRAGPEHIANYLGSATREKKHPTIHEEQLFGRQWQLSTLRSQFDRLEVSDKPVVVLVRGKSGEGKSILVRRFLSELKQSRDFVLLEGRCYDRESVPFKALDSLIDALSNHMRHMEPMDVALLLPEDVGLLASVFPVLRRVEVIEKKCQQGIPELDGQQTRKRAFRALRSLLRGIARKLTVVLFIDDLQWGDADSAEALFSILTDVEAPRVLFVGSYRSDEAHSSPFLQAWEDCAGQSSFNIPLESVDVGPLTLEQCAAMVQSAFPGSQNASRQIAQKLLEETAGNAFFISDLLEGMKTSKGRNRYLPLHERIEAKLNSLPDSAATLLATVVVAGQVLDAEEAIESAQVSDGYGLLSNLRKLKLVRLLGDEHSPQVDTYHDKIRESVLESIGPTGRKAFHQKLAETIEARTVDLNYELLHRIVSGDDEVQHPPCGRIFDLAFHYDAAGNAQKASEFAILAAEQAMRQFSPSVAAVQYERAIRNFKQRAGACCGFRIHAGYAESLIRIGRYEDSLAAAEACEDFAQTELEQALIQSLRGEACYKRQRPEADISHATAAYRRGLRLLGVWVPQGKLLTIAAATKEILQHSCLILMRRPDCGKRKPTKQELLALQLRRQLNFSAGMSEGPLMAWGIFSALNVMRHYPANREMAMSYVLYSVIVSAMGLSRRCVWAVDRSLEIQRGLNDEFGIAHATSWAGIMRISCAEYAKAEVVLRESVRRFKEVGEVWELELAQLHLAYALYMQGRMEEAIEQCYEAFERAVKYQDMRSNCTLYLLARITHGNLPMERLLPQVVRSDNDVLSTCNLHKAEALAALHQGDLDKAQDLFWKSVWRPIQAMYPNFHAYAGLPYMVTVLRAKIAANPTNSTLLKQAKKAARRAAFWCRLIPNEYPFALREYAEVQILLGNVAKAKKYFDKSIRIAEKQGASYEADLSRHARAQLVKQSSEPGSESTAQEAENVIRDHQLQIDRVLHKLGLVEHSE